MPLQYEGLQPYEENDEALRRIPRSLRTPHKPEVRAIDVIAVFLDELVRMTNFRVRDFRADVVLV